MKWWADWLADNPRDYARCPGLTHLPQIRTYVEADVIIGHPLPCTGRAACLSAVGSRLIGAVPGG